MVMGRTPSNPLKLIKETWTGKNQLPLNAGKYVTEFLTELQKHLKDTHDYAETHSEQE